MKHQEIRMNNIEETKRIKVSVIIPVYNVKNYIEECLDSLIKQSLREIEIICVDDASEDSSLTIVKECAKKDSRIQIIAYDTNKSASQARKDGTLMAKGEYIMYLDGDDYLQPNTCEELYSAISKKNVDILHFGTNVINEGNTNEQRIKNLVKFLEPYPYTLHDKDVFKGCFKDKKYQFTLWNKIYRSSLCKKAFQYIKDGNFPKAQDLYAFFVLCFFAQSYSGITDSYYNYRFGAGISGKDELSLSQYERYCHSVSVADAIEEFIAEQGATEYSEIVSSIRENLLNECINSWFSYIKPAESSQGFDILCKYWDKKEIVSLLCAKHYFKKKMLAEKILASESIRYKAENTIKTIGIFYYRYTPGGVQRVISLLIPMYIEMGYKVVLFTDEFSQENEYVLPDEVTRIVLPSSLTIKKNEYHQRAEVFLEAVKKHKIDVVCYQAASSGMLIFDLLLLKLNQIPIILTVHEVAFQNLLTMNSEMVNRPTIYRVADYITVLSRVEEKYWRCFGVNARYVPNPIENKLIHRDLSKVEKNTILWVGRLDAKTKRCMDIISIMKYVVRYIPDAKLLVLGGEYTPGILDKMKDKIEKNNLENNIELCGYDTNVGPYYCRSELHILTSISETFPMVIAESKAYGMPLVMYELPFVEFARDARGIVNVPQGNEKMMANTIISILNDENYKQRLQNEAHESLKDFLAVDLKKEWSKIFSSLGCFDVKVEEDETTSVLLRSFLQHYEYGVTINNNKKVEWNKKIVKAKKAARKKKVAWKKKTAELNKLKNSWDYKLGHAILFIPRLIINRLKNIL